MKYQIILILSYYIIKLSASNSRTNKGLISTFGLVQTNESETGTTQNVDDYRDSKYFLLSN